MAEAVKHLLVKLAANDTAKLPEANAVPPSSETNMISQLSTRAIAGIVLASIIIVIGLVVSVRALYQKVTENKYNREEIRYSEILITDDAEEDHVD